MPPSFPQLSALLGKDYDKLTDDFHDLLMKVYGECDELEFVTPALVIEWARRNEHSVYFLNNNI